MNCFERFAGGTSVWWRGMYGKWVHKGSVRGIPRVSVMALIRSTFRCRVQNLERGNSWLSYFPFIQCIYCPFISMLFEYEFKWQSQLHLKVLLAVRLQPNISSKFTPRVSVTDPWFTCETGRCHISTTRPLQCRFFTQRPRGRSMTPFRATEFSVCMALYLHPFFLCNI